MERLTIDEVIEYCTSYTSEVESYDSKVNLEQSDMDCPGMTKYWAHRQVPQWLEELKHYRAAEAQGVFKNSQLNIGDIVYIVSRGVIIPLEITSAVLNKDGIAFIGSNKEHLGHSHVTLHDDERAVCWYSTAAEAADTIQSKCSFNPENCQKFCSDCVYLDTTQHIGHKQYVCTNNNRKRCNTSYGHTKKMTTPACKSGFKSKYVPDMNKEKQHE